MTDDERGGRPGDFNWDGKSLTEQREEIERLRDEATALAYQGADAIGLPGVRAELLRFADLTHAALDNVATGYRYLEQLAEIRQLPELRPDEGPSHDR